ncbi:interleukin-27 subunit beta isoform X1 [Antennarius striatus]|uniref:interleukin-27 subunit beta isoform X1 n=1 Tax=Antennarius striatus TaxID=241820 RepID=UPI0035AE2003
MMVCGVCGVCGVCVVAVLLLCVAGGRTSGTPPWTPEVRCWCASYPNVTLCSWAEPPHGPPTRYIATYSERRAHPAARQCRLIPPGSSSSILTSLSSSSSSSSSSSLSSSSSSSERVWHCHLPYLKILTDYIINVTAVHAGGSSSHLSSFTLEEIGEAGTVNSRNSSSHVSFDDDDDDDDDDEAFDHFPFFFSWVFLAVVKPDPPVDVRVSPVGVRNLLVEWSPPPTWANLDILPLKYQVQYRWSSRGTPNSVHIGPLEMTSVELKGLTRGRPYLFQVCAKELLDLGECSDWSSAVEIIIPKTKL